MQKHLLVGYKQTGIWKYLEAKSKWMNSNSIWISALEGIPALKKTRATKVLLILSHQSVPPKGNIFVLGRHDWCWSWSANTLAAWYKELTHWKRPWCWGRLKTKGEGGHKGWDGWLASPTQWTWVWASSGRLCRTGRPGVLQSVGSQRVGRNLVTEQQLQYWKAGHRV